MRPWGNPVRSFSRQFSRQFVLGTRSLTFSTAPSGRPLTTCSGLLRGANRPLRHGFQIGRAYSSLGKHGEDTIYALSTAPGRAAIAIIRISGPSALSVYHALCPSKPAPKPRYATLRTLYDPISAQDDKKVLDSGALVFYFPSPETASGEDVLELHVHGGTAVVKAVLSAIPRALAAVQGEALALRYAEPGEFTRRAFYNNRLDLTQIEALGDTLSAETEQQRRLAVRGSSSFLADRYETWRQKLLYARGELEALIDFSEDQHFDESPAELCSSVAKQVEELNLQLRANIQSAMRGEMLRNGINIALVGAPNAGKSSLLNCIVGREAAIVSQEAGTTRDVVDVSVDVGGYLCRFGDLAGLRNDGIGGPIPVGTIEEEGMRRARERALVADVVIMILGARELRVTTNNTDSKATTVIDLDPEVADLLQQLNPETQKVVCVLNKTDLFDSPCAAKQACDALAHSASIQRFRDPTNGPIYPISCKHARDPTNVNDLDPGGIQALLAGLIQLFGTMTSPILPKGQMSIGNNSTWAESLGATARQRALLVDCLFNLTDFVDLVQPVKVENGERDIDIVLAAEFLRSAADCLARITGRGAAGDVEEVLGVVFEKYSFSESIAFYPMLIP